MSVAGLDVVDVDGGDGLFFVLGAPLAPRIFG